ncbi:MAG: RHS repeat-associated core domain-containing protein [Arenimonas sp.]
MSAVLAIAEPHRIKRSHRRRGKVTSGRFVQRYYDPVIGRFLSVDPVETNPNTGGSFNRYKYASNNPYKFIDPDGRAETLAFNSADGLHAAGSVFRIPGMHTLSGHGNTRIMEGANGQPYSASDIISLGRSNGLKEGQTIFTAVCNVGSDKATLAQSLADKNNGPVWAPNGYVMYPTTIDSNPFDLKGPYKPGNPVTLTVNSAPDGSGEAMTFNLYKPGGNGQVFSKISSVRFDPKTGEAKIRIAPETGSRITRTITVDRKK